MDWSQILVHVVLQHWALFPAVFKIWVRLNSQQMVNFLGEEISRYYSILVVVWLLKDLFSSVYSENSNKRIGKWCHQLNAPRHTHKKCKMISKDFSLKREYFEKNKAAGKRCLVKTTIFRNKFPSLTRLTFNHLKPWLKEPDTYPTCRYW